MNYLTQYYKNLSEQLEAKVNHLQNLIEAKKKKLDPVGKEDADVNNDGKENKTDEYLLHRREVVGKAIKGKKKNKNSKDKK